MSIKVNVELGQKVWFFRYDGDDNDFVIEETRVARINISQRLPDYKIVADWCEDVRFIELENSFVFDIEQVNGNYVVDNDPFDGKIFFGYTKEEAEAKIKFINASEAEKQEREEFETYKRLHEKFKDRI